MQDKQPKTFRGRRIVEIDWRGKKAEAVEGLFAYQGSGVHGIRPGSFRGPRGTRVTPVGPVDRLGIGVLLIEGSVYNDLAYHLPQYLGGSVEWVEPVLIERAASRPNDHDFLMQWGLQLIHAERAWKLSNADPGRVLLAVLDSGAPIQSGRLSHEDLSDSSRFLLGLDLINNRSSPIDDNGHGTHVLGIAGATRDNSVGIAGLWNGPVFVVKVFNTLNVGTCITFKDGVLGAIDFAQNHKMKMVINYSGGGPDSEIKKKAICEALANDVLVVAAAGNHFANSIDFPAAYSTDFKNVMGVTAINSIGERDPASNLGKGLTVAAPGVDIFSTMPNYYVHLNNEFTQMYSSMSGTSMACAFVSGLAALVRSKFDKLTAAEVRERIASNSDPRPGRENEFGCGIIDAEKALT